MKNAPDTFQWLANQVLDRLDGFAVAYLNDIVIFSNSWEKHHVHLSQVLERLRTAGMTIKPGKCQIDMSEVQYRGKDVGGGEPRPGQGTGESGSNYSPA